MTNDLIERLNRNAVDAKVPVMARLDALEAAQALRLSQQREERLRSALREIEIYPIGDVDPKGPAGALDRRLKIARQAIKDEQ